MGMTKKEIDSKFDEIVDFSGIGEFIDTPVKRYSSGMYSRLGFSVAAHMDPDILLVDEVLAVGDIAFQAKCAQKMRELLNSGTTIMLVSHNLPLIQNLCKRVILLNKGEIIKEGTPDEVIPYYQNIVYGKQEEELKKRILSDSDKVAINTDSLVNISDVLLYNGELKHKTEFRIGEPISIKLNYEAKERIENPIFTIDVIRADGVLCCSSNTKDDNFAIASIDGRGAIDINLGNLNLAPATYFAKISIWDKEMVHPYVIRKNDVFRIQAGGSGSDIKAVFIPKAEWRL
jgi:ABC-type proline/glycine betaine transport system ATPase subunit